jgi:universal stress protein F
MQYYKHILVPVDLGHGEVGEHILSVAKFLVGASGKITLITVLEHAPTGDVLENVHTHKDATGNPLRIAHDKLSALARSVGVDAQIVLCEGAAAQQILEEAEKSGCDSIIIGSHRPDYRDYFIGSTASRVVRHAQVSVMVERNGPLIAPSRA